ncbi:hypothetical protein AAFF_G00196140 [Aldrovandia affinis]|uniref:Uncharacterized protein n=1 Tax=Aldrovandia affinis TaxID=143900 RepID=A0AAD7RIT1_9TELE|nr:hypothetical protein AAFF_G00196140 [Aldrovandia affinis]
MSAYQVAPPPPIDQSRHGLDTASLAARMFLAHSHVSLSRYSPCLPNAPCASPSRSSSRPSLPYPLRHADACTLPLSSAALVANGSRLGREAGLVADHRGRRSTRLSLSNPPPGAPGQAGTPSRPRHCVPPDHPDQKQPLNDTEENKLLPSLSSLWCCGSGQERRPADTTAGGSWRLTQDCSGGASSRAFRSNDPTRSGDIDSPAACDTVRTVRVAVERLRAPQPMSRFLFLRLSS